MKRLFIILLILYSLISQGLVQAQIYSTASKRYNTYSTAGVASSPGMYEFQTTSTYVVAKSNKNFATAPMQVANGSIKTIASTITGGVLSNSTTTSGEYIPTQTTTPVIPGVPDLPLGDGCDVFLFLGLLSILYAMYLTRKIGRVKL